MTRYTLTAGAAGTLLVLLAGGALAAGTSAPPGERLRCLLAHARANPHHVVTVCDTRAPEGLARLRAAKCDPAVRGRCAAMMGDHRAAANPGSDD